MNFRFLDSLSDLDIFKRYCCEAEDFVQTYPDVSVTAARKATEYMVKLLYGSSINSTYYGMTVFDMLSDPKFIAWLSDDVLLNRFHFIRQRGNRAVHHGGMTQDDAMKTLEQLHILAGDICLRLGLIKNYPPFDPKLTEAPDDEPTVDQALIERFAGRLHNMFAPSQQRAKVEIIDGFVSTKDMSALKKLDPAAKMENTAANSRAAFQIIGEYLANTLGAENVLADYHDLCLHVTTNSRKFVIAIRTGSCRLAVKSATGDWLYLPGIDYVLYTDKVDANVPVLQQFRVFTPQEFRNLWEGIKLLRKVVSSSTAKRLKQVLGADVKISIEEYADELCVQTISTAHKKKQQTIKDTLASLPTLENGGLEKILHQ